VWALCRTIKGDILNIQIINRELSKEIRTTLERAAAVRWMADYGERFPAQWEITSINMVGNLIDITFSWEE
jgi:hypothetical protein